MPRWESKDFFSEINPKIKRTSSPRLKGGEISEQIFPRTGRISGLEVGKGAKLDVPTTDRQNEKNKNNLYLMKRCRLKRSRCESC